MHVVLAKMITCQLLQFLLEFIDLGRVLVLAVLLLPVNLVKPSRIAFNRYFARS